MAEKMEKKRCEIRQERTGDDGLPRDVDYYESAVIPPLPTCVYLENNKVIKEENVTQTEGPNAEFNIGPEPLAVKVETEMFEKNELNEPSSSESCKSRLENHEKDLVPNYKGPFKCEHCPKFFALKTNLIKHYRTAHPPEKVVHKNLTDSSINVETRKRIMKKHLEKQKYLTLPESDKPGPVIDKEFCKNSELNDLVDVVKSEPASPESCKSSPESHIMRKHNDKPDYKGPLKCEHCHKFFALKTNLIRHYTMDHPPETVVKIETDSDVAMVTRDRVITKKLEQQKDFILAESDPDDRSNPVSDQQFCENSELNELVDAVKSEPSPEPSYINMEDEKFTIEDNEVKTEDHNAESNNADPEPVGIENKPEMGTDDLHPLVVDQNKHKKVYECDIRGKRKCHSHKTFGSNKQPFSCDICSRAFKRKYYLWLHMEAHCDSKSFTCDICKAKFKKKIILATHMKCHSDSRPFTCKICSKKFKWKSNLTKHIKIHSDSRPFSCDICTMKFKLKSGLAAHMKIHSDDRPFSCDICTMKFKRKDHLAGHMKTHSDDRPFCCNICNVNFKRDGDLAAHVKTHSDDRPFYCNICNVNFKRNGDLARHMKSHSESRPLSCDICKSKFQLKFNLATHMKIHSDSRPFSCDICAMKFKWKSVLAAHIMKSHSDSRPFPCDICGKRFKLKLYLAAHMKIHSDDRTLACNSDSDSVPTHSKGRPFSCDICKMKFKWKRVLAAHMNCHGLH